MLQAFAAVHPGDGDSDARHWEQHLDAGTEEQLCQLPKGSQLYVDGEFEQRACLELLAKIRFNEVGIQINWANAIR